MDNTQTHVKNVYYVNHTKKEISPVSVRVPSNEDGILEYCWNAALGIKDAIVNGPKSLNVSGWSRDDNIEPCKDSTPYIDQGYLMK